MRSIELATCSGAMALALLGTGSVQEPEIADRITRLLDAYEDWGFSGVVLVAHESAIVFEAGYGYANRETGEKNTPDTRYDFASIAKTFTGAALLTLEAEGAIRVQDQLEQYIGAFPDSRKSEATFHHLATHTAGLAHRSESELAYGPDRRAYIESMKHAPFETPPGESYRYSNAGASFAAALVEEISGTPFEEFVRSRFFGPLEMQSAQFVFETEPGESGLALGYQDESETAAPAAYEGEWGWGRSGATGVVATAHDMFLWFDGLHHGDVLPVEQRQKVFDSSAEEAYGWHSDQDEADRRRIHKGGGLDAMQSQIRAYPDEGIVIVWAHNNMSRNWRQSLNDGISAVSLGESFGPVPRIDPNAGPGSRVELRPGVYATGGGTMLELSTGSRGPVLGGNGLGMPSGELRPGMNEDWVLFSPDDVAWIRIAESPGGDLVVTEGPGGLTSTLSRTTRAAAAMLAEPTAEVLTLVRGYAESLLAGDAEAVWSGTLYRPLRDSNSLEDWRQRASFLSSRVGAEARILEEAWVVRDGTWRYWRSFESEKGAQAMLRFQLTEDGQIAGYGMNPVAGAPEVDEKRVIR